MEKMYNLKEVADILGIKVRTVREWIKTGYLKAKKYDGKRFWVVSQEEINRIKGE